MELIPIVLMATLVGKLVDFVRQVRGKDLNGVLTQVVAWIAGVAIVLLFAESDWANAVQFGDIFLDQMNFASQVIAGLALASGYSTFKDFLKSRDATQTSALPSLLDGVTRTVDPKTGGTISDAPPPNNS